MLIPVKSVGSKVWSLRNKSLQPQLLESVCKYSLLTIKSFGSAPQVLYEFPTDRVTHKYGPVKQLAEQIIKLRRIASPILINCRIALNPYRCFSYTLDIFFTYFKNNWPIINKYINKGKRLHGRWRHGAGAHAACQGPSGKAVVAYSDQLTITITYNVQTKHTCSYL